MMTPFEGEVFDEQGVPLGTVEGYYTAGGGPIGEGHIGMIGSLLLRPGNKKVDILTHYILAIEEFFYLIYICKMVEDEWKTGYVNDIIRGLPEH